MKNRKSTEERRLSARYNPAAAEPLIFVEESSPTRPRSNSHATSNDLATNSMAVISPKSENGVDPEAPAKTATRQEASKDNGSVSSDDEEKLGLIQSLRSYPKGVFFMLGNEFCERFSFYGMRAILIMYFIFQHQFEVSTAKMLYHGFVSIAYLAPLVGSVAADNYFGRFRVILWVSLLYVFGHFMLTFGAVPYLNYSIQTTLDFGGLIVIALATGGIKPCVSAFAADQFEPHQHRQRAQFFSFFYFSINAGSLLAITLTPLLRGRVSCLGSPYCFPLAFGVPGILMLVAFLLFLFGWRFYKITPARKGNVVFKVVKCIGYAMKGKISAVCKNQNKKPHWIDYAAPKYSPSLIAGVKSLLAVSLLFVPVVFFWALFDQQGSTWVLQASQMDGRVGPFTILPDQMNTFNPLIVLIMVPIFEAFIYPFASKFVKITPLRKMGLGGILAALAFIMAGFLQLQVSATLEPLPSSDNVFIQKFGDIDATLGGTFLTPGEKTELLAAEQDLVFNNVTEKFVPKIGAEAYVLGVFGTPPHYISFPYSLDKANNGETGLILLVPQNTNLVGTYVMIQDYKGKVVNTEKAESKTMISIQPGLYSTNDYTIRWGKNCQAGKVDECNNKRTFVAQSGAVDILYLNEKTSEVRNVVRANSVSVLWQLPQFFVITLGEVLFSVTGLEFSYSQASPNMKSVLQAMWLLTTFAGNVIDMGISGLKIFTNPALEFFFYGFLMFVVVGVFIWIAVSYKYVDEEAFEAQIEHEIEEEEEEEEEEAAAAAAAAVAATKSDTEKVAINDEQPTNSTSEKTKLDTPL